MVKQVKCPFCGRLNSPSNFRCSNCGMNLSGSIEKTTEKERRGELSALLTPLIPYSSKKEKNFKELLKPSDTKIFLFVNMVFATIFMPLIAFNRYLFALIFYPSLYWFACYQTTKKKFNWGNFLSEFILFNAFFAIIFAVIPSLI